MQLYQNFTWCKHLALKGTKMTNHKFLTVYFLSSEDQKISNNSLRLWSAWFFGQLGIPALFSLGNRFEKSTEIPNCPKIRANQSFSCTGPNISALTFLRFKRFRWLFKLDFIKALWLKYLYESHLPCFSTLFFKTFFFGPQEAQKSSIMFRQTTHKLTPFLFLPKYLLEGAVATVIELRWLPRGRYKKT